VWDNKLFEGLTSKQKKNLRKKLQRQRKKQENKSVANSSLDSKGSEKEIDGEIDDIDIDIGDKKSPGKPSEMDMEGGEIAEEEAPVNVVNSKRGRKLDEKVMVKICDMGNGCWTYHHFTPEI